jgi:hypothetical protein
LACLSPEYGGNLPLPPLELLGEVFYTMTALVTTILTTMICFKLLLQRRRLASQSGALRANGKVYLSVVAILVESAAPYALCSWIWVVLSFTRSFALDWFDGVFIAASVCFLFTAPSVDANVVLDPG